MLQRIGYGAQFNELYIKGNTITKRSKNEYGLKKIKHEIAFYQFLSNQCSTFKAPLIIEYYENGYKMNYLQEYRPIYTLFASLQENVIKHIYDQLHCLHSLDKKVVSKEYFTDCLYREMIVKNKERIGMILSLVDSFVITHVNGVELKTLFEIQELLTYHMNTFIDSQTEYVFVPIHGDCQFNNILYKEGESVVFIDPRGYFGTSQVFGLKEYDDAKIRFALSGYDVFDNKSITEYQLTEGHFTFLDERFDDTCFDKKDFITALTISIWLGNAHCFIQQPAKALTSYARAMYYASVYL